MSASVMQGVNPPKVYIALLVGPDMSGKTTFSRMAFNYFCRRFPDFVMDVLIYEKSSYKQIIYQLKSYATKTISTYRDANCRQLILVDAKDFQNTNNRFEVFQFCLMFDVVYLQIYMAFDAEEIIARCARKGLFINPRTLQNPELFNTTCLGTDPRTQWQSNSITIFKTFFKNAQPEFNRLYNFLLNCIPAPKNSVYVSCIPRVSLEYNNPHKLQMQAGISYKDKLLNGKEDTTDQKITKRRFSQ